MGEVQKGACELALERIRETGKTVWLVVVGEDDIPTPVREAERIARGIPGASLEIIRRAGHVCTAEQPEAVNEVLVRFLEGLNNSSAQPSPATH